MITVLFWISIAILFHTYIGYGLIISLIARVKKMRSPVQVFKRNLSTVTLVIPAYNEEEFIETKVENCLQLEYPKNKFRIVFITDGSTDKTVDILRKYDEVEVLHSDQRQGKSAAINRAMKYIDSEIVVFNDANTLLDKSAIKMIAQSFNSPRVGAVSGEKTIIVNKADGTSARGEGMYWKYESYLKRKDAEVLSVMGAAGELIAFRKKLVEQLDSDVILDDFMMTFSVIKQGYKVSYLPEVKAIETASVNVEEELKRKTRIAAGGWQAMSRLLWLFKFWETPLLSFMFISHRALRWSLSAFLLPVVLILNSGLFQNGLFYQLIFLAQLVFYLFALFGYFYRNSSNPPKLGYVPFYFVMMNYAVFVGFWRFVKGNQSSVWERALRAA
ncbi:MAG: glycosyltransferase family 2 protein [Schleiferiaceae bacterium]|jgi:cellulose synthase/poly-beta-1,6-N-acetylglucosamine synthase-like glycosyltransferase|nr:glycosyltransferase family 2 protein [Schleiferiaceae bacterium]